MADEGIVKLYHISSNNPLELFETSADGRHCVVPSEYKGAGAGGQTGGFFVFADRREAIASIKNRSTDNKSYLTEITVKKQDLQYPEWEYDAEFNSASFPLMLKYIERLEGGKPLPFSWVEKTGRLAFLSVDFAILKDKETDKPFINGCLYTNDGTKKRISLFADENEVVYTEARQIVHNLLSRTFPDYVQEYNELLLNPQDERVCYKYCGFCPLEVSAITLISADGAEKKETVVFAKDTKDKTTEFKSTQEHKAAVIKAVKGGQDLSHNDTIYFARLVSEGVIPVGSVPKEQIQVIYTQLLDFALNDVAFDANTLQKPKTYHGLFTHTRNVAMRGVDMAVNMGKDPLPVMLAAVLHDTARTGDGYNEKHGMEATANMKAFLAKYAKKFDLAANKQEQVLHAVANHTTGVAENAVSYVDKCLWDADRIRLSWERGYQEDYFCTAYGRKLAAMDYKQQQEYQHRLNDINKAAATPSHKAILNKQLKGYEIAYFDKYHNRIFRKTDTKILPPAANNGNGVIADICLQNQSR